MLNTERNFCIKARQAETQQQGTLPRVSRQIHGEFVAYYQRKGDEKRYEENVLSLASRKKTKWVDSYNKVLRRMTHRRVLCQTFMLGYANTKPSYSNKRCREPE